MRPPPLPRKRATSCGLPSKVNPSGTIACPQSGRTSGSVTATSAPRAVRRSAMNRCSGASSRGGDPGVNVTVSNPTREPTSSTSSSSRSAIASQTLRSSALSPLIDRAAPARGTATRRCGGLARGTSRAAYGGGPVIAADRVQRDGAEPAEELIRDRACSGTLRWSAVTQSVPPSEKPMPATNPMAAITSGDSRDGDRVAQSVGGAERGRAGSLRRQAEPTTTASRAPLPGARATVHPTASRKNDAHRTMVLRNGVTRRALSSCSSLDVNRGSARR